MNFAGFRNNKRVENLPASSKVDHPPEKSPEGMKDIAIIGTGIAGLGCAHFLQRRFNLCLYEKNLYPGGHANTVEVEEEDGPKPIDTGFMVYNEVTYPNLTRLFRELDVAVKPAPMSFSVQHRPTGLEFAGSSVNHLFAQRKNLFRPRFWRLLRQIYRFNSDAAAALNSPACQEQTLADYVRERRYGADLLDFYLVPMSSAVWSTAPSRMLEFPAITLLRFFQNHGFLGLHGHLSWMTVQGGSKAYVEKLSKPFRSAIQLGRGAIDVRREGGRARVTDTAGSTRDFDHVIFACHADEALSLLSDADGAERALLGEFGYQSNSALLHTDTSVMPRTRRTWSSWNYRMDAGPDGQTTASTVYWMNSLQGVSKRTNYFISINGEGSVRADLVLRTFRYDHPLFTLGALRAQQQLAGLNRPASPILYCGSYFKYGFHEDAFSSALELCRTLTGERLWQ